MSTQNCDLPTRVLSRELYNRRSLDEVVLERSNLDVGPAGIAGDLHRTSEQAWVKVDGKQTHGSNSGLDPLGCLGTFFGFVVTVVEGGGVFREVGALGRGREFREERFNGALVRRGGVYKATSSC